MRFKIITICLLLFSLIGHCQIYEGPNLKFDKAIGKNDIKGKKTGEWMFYRKDNSLSAKMYFKNGKREGLKKIYWENGNVYTIANYINGKIEGIDKTYYKDGSIAYSIPYKNGLKNGEEKKYKNNGTIYSIKNYKNDALHGVSIDFDSDGEISKNGTYENGKKQGKWLSYRKGKVSLEAEYNLDVPHGIWKKRFSYPEELNDKVKYEYKISNGAIINPIKIYDYTDMYSKDGKVDKQFWIGNVNRLYTLDSPSIFKKIGEWKKYNSKGNLISEEMFDSDGITISKLDYFDNGKLKYKSIRDKNNIIKEIGYYENGKISFKSESKFISEYTKEKISSEFYDEEGRLEYKQDGINCIRYYKGKISEAWTEDDRGYKYGEYLKYYTSNGNIYIRGNFSYLKDKNGYNIGYKMGIWIEYHDNGEIKMQGNYARNEDDVFEGLKDGAWKYYNEKGELIKIENYSNGIKQ